MTVVGILILVAFASFICGLDVTLEAFEGSGDLTINLRGTCTTIESTAKVDGRTNRSCFDAEGHLCDWNVVCWNTTNMHNNVPTNVRIYYGTDGTKGEFMFSFSEACIHMSAEQSEIAHIMALYPYKFYVVVEHSKIEQSPLKCKRADMINTKAHNTSFWDYVRPSPTTAFECDKTCDASRELFSSPFFGDVAMPYYRSPVIQETRRNGYSLFH